MLYESIERMWTPSPAIPLNIMFLSCMHALNECGQRVSRKKFENKKTKNSVCMKGFKYKYILCCMNLLNECGRQVQQSLLILFSSLVCMP